MKKIFSIKRDKNQKLLNEDNFKFFSIMYLNMICIFYFIDKLNIDGSEYFRVLFYFASGIFIYQLISILFSERVSVYADRNNLRIIGEYYNFLFLGFKKNVSLDLMDDSKNLDIKFKVSNKYKGENHFIISSRDANEDIIIFKNNDLKEFNKKISLFVEQSKIR